MKAKEWHIRGKSSTDPFDAFGNYWRGFNNLFSGNQSERELIKLYIRKHIDEDFAKQLIVAQEENILILTKRPLKDMRRNGRNTANFINQYSKSDSYIEKLEAIFLIIYQIRCNFEHGQKSPSRSIDKSLCVAACPFVDAIIEHTA